MFALKKQALIFTAALTVFCSLAGGICGGIADAAADYRLTIVIDAGHGGVDAGVRGVYSGEKESNINLAIAFYLKGYLSDAGFNTVMTRKTQAGLYGLPVKGFKKRDMARRKEIIENCGADIVISIHQNYSPQTSRRGAQVYFDGDNTDGKLLADGIKKGIDGMADCVRETDVLAGDYYMLKCTQNASVIVECGFLSNAQDDALLCSESYRKSIAYAIFTGTVYYMA